MSDNEPALQVVIGDTLLTLEFPVVDQDGKAVDLTAGNVRVFAKGRASSDRVTSVVGGTIAKTIVTITQGDTVVTPPNMTGIVEGMRIFTAAGTHFAPGTEIIVVGGSTFTINRPAIGSGSNISTGFWDGVVCDLSAGAQGLARVQGLPALMRPGALTTETYDYDIRFKNAGGKIGYSDPDQIIATTPVI
ncbi:MAG: hypothetical protein RI885_2258 [Actinomycetota bacterium]|jgi:hypothetical protein